MADAARVVLVLAVEEEVKVVVLTTRHPTGQHATRDERQDNMTRKETTEDNARRHMTRDEKRERERNSFATTDSTSIRPFVRLADKQVPYHSTLL